MVFKGEKMEKKGLNILIRSNGKKIKLGSKVNLKAEKGDVLHIETPGGRGVWQKKLRKAGTDRDFL